MLSGKAVHQMDAKYRIRIPTKFKKEFPEKEQLYFVRYAPGRISIMPKSVLDKKMQAFEDIAPDDIEAYDAMMALYSSVEEINEDSQGRVQVPKWIREYAGLKEELITVGMGSYAELWDLETFEKRIGCKSIEEINATVYRKKQQASGKAE